MSNDLRVRLSEALDRLATKERHVIELQKFIEQQQRTIESLNRLVISARQRIEVDEDTFIRALEDIILKVRSYSWVAEGRGNYQWDDEEYQRETARAFDDIIEIAHQGIALSRQLFLDFWKPLNKSVESALETSSKVPLEETEFSEHWELRCQ